MLSSIIMLKNPSLACCSRASSASNTFFPCVPLSLHTDLLFERLCSGFWLGIAGIRPALSFWHCPGSRGRLLGGSAVQARMDGLQDSRLRTPAWPSTPPLVPLRLYFLSLRLLQLRGLGKWWPHRRDGERCGASGVVRHQNASVT